MQGGTEADSGRCAAERAAVDVLAAVCAATGVAAGAAAGAERALLLAHAGLQRHAHGHQPWRCAHLRLHVLDARHAQVCLLHFLFNLSWPTQAQRAQCFLRSACPSLQPFLCFSIETTWIAVSRALIAAMAIPALSRSKMNSCIDIWLFPIERR